MLPSAASPVRLQLQLHAACMKAGSPWTSSSSSISTSSSSNLLCRVVPVSAAIGQCGARGQGKESSICLGRRGRGARRVLRQEQGKGAKRRHGVLCMAGEEPSEKKPTEEGSKPTAPPPSSPPSGSSPPPPDSPSGPTAEFPALRTAAESVQLPKEVVETLRNQIFGFDTFFVTAQEPYEGGVLFQGNLRGAADKAHAKVTQRLKERYGDSYVLYFLRSPTEERPVAVVVPRESILPLPGPIPEAAAAAAFGFTSLLTTLLSNAPSLDLGFIPDAEYLTGPLLQALPPSLVLLASLAAHEAAHQAVAKSEGIKIDFPVLIPSWQLGTFGGITRITSVVPSRKALALFGASGPLAGSAVALLLLLVSLLLPADLLGSPVPVESSAFHDSTLVGLLAKLVFGDALQEGSVVGVSPIALAAWTGLLINAINTIPTGELDGGRVALAIFGRQWAGRLSIVSLFLLGVTGIFDDIALFWIIVIFVLQRGPITPQANEITQPDNSTKLVGASALVLGFLVYCPLLIPFS